MNRPSQRASVSPPLPPHILERLPARGRADHEWFQLARRDDVLIGSARIEGLSKGIERCSKCLDVAVAIIGVERCENGVTGEQD